MGARLFMSDYVFGCAWCCVVLLGAACSLLGLCLCFAWRCVVVLGVWLVVIGLLDVCLGLVIRLKN